MSVMSAIAIVAAAGPSAEVAEVPAGRPETQAALGQWKRALAELGEVDRVVAELQAELRLMQVRRKVVAQGEMAARRRLVELGALPEDAAEATSGKTAPAPSARKAPAAEPLVFDLNDYDGLDDGSPGSTAAGDDAASSSGSSSMEDWEQDWEQSLAMMHGAGARDRATVLRAHLLAADQRPTKPGAAAAMVGKRWATGLAC
eukprot:CAMPEP_0176074540 /NCGR_PEP_ID=MMETSP0120_2-20121206/37251_1 /TAXON_ID=160619 /ORGANISM="Kryptoperidinium foliaceum, Strain CCMP 1326" /LENGTH=201 /DNA_ID=CAMNT_0017408235 /DNA_START=43 /DNA_END=648 /DNA_ORIENTATION=-